MKKHILLATGLAVLSTSAFATKARLEALGEGNDGSHFIKDTRNIFLNPAAVNEYKNYVVTEWGDGGNNNAANDVETSPNAEGGFFREAGSFAYGVYLGNNSRDQNNAKTTGDGTDTFIDTDNSIDLFIAGEAGLEWGVRLHHASSKNESATLKQDGSALGVGVGVAMGDLSASANLDVTNDVDGSSRDSSDKFEGDFGTDLNVSYAFGSTTVWADFDKQGNKQTINAVAVERENTTLEVGAGKTHDVSSSTRIYYSLRFRSTKEETKQTANPTSDETKRTTLPLSVGFEAEATSWLTLRGSVTQSVVINNSERTIVGGATAGVTEQSNHDTNVNAGATLNFGKLKVDGSIGTSSAGGGSIGNDAGILSFDNLLARVGVHYWF